MASLNLYSIVPSKLLVDKQAPRVQSTNMKEDTLQLGGLIFEGNPHEEGWELKAKCQNAGDILFARGAVQNKIVKGCGGCAVQAACLREAIEQQDEWGIRGGLTERQRRKFVKELGGFTNALEVIDHDRNEARAQQIAQNNNPQEYARVAVPLRIVASHTMGLDLQTQIAS